MGKQYTQPGAVSIFAVIFAALLLTILTVGFIRLMISEQQRATNSDLSQSAYDAALAGVEDAKRVVRACVTNPESQACSALAESSDCKVIARAGIAGDESDEETVIQTTTGAGGGSDFNQAYTCVNIDMNTPDFLLSAKEGSSQLVPLKASGDYDTVTIEWFTQQDVGEGNNVKAPAGGLSDLPARDAWVVGAPPMIRAQLITPGASFTLNDLNDTAASKTVFLRPFTLGGGSLSTSVMMDGLIRATDADAYDNENKPITCSQDLEANNGYSCRAVLELGSAVPQADSSNTFLRLETIYRSANVRVQLRNSLDDSVVSFVGIQPSVDSTGRTSNLFRRVEARLQIGNDFPYPSYAVDLANSFCKDFSVDSERVITNYASCAP